MADDISFDVNLDSQGYVSGTNAIAIANTRLGQSFTMLGMQASGMQRALDMASPSTAVSQRMGGLTRAAADAQQQFSSFAATASVTGASYDKLSEQAKKLARDFPIGSAAATQVVSAFTKMGVSGKGAESQIGSLSKTIVQLSGATGEGPSQLAEGMTNLARATGNTALDPARFSKMADSVTQVSASAGASATSILSFGKNIAPFAQSIGIGTTGILGISGAFARMGEDGAVASNAVAKMMADLNRSVRDGSPDIKAYAEYVGMTVDQFKDLVKADPTQAVSRVIDAVGKAGPEGQRMLERIGIDSIRSQRPLAEVSGAGGLQSFADQARGAYGSGATAKAADAAFGGLNDSMGELDETVKQLAEALGTPLLGGLTLFSKALKGPAELARSAASSDFAQKAMQIGGGAFFALMVGKMLAGPLAAFGVGRQIATASPTRALFAGYAGRDTGTFASRFGAPVNELYEREGVYGRGIAAGPAARAFAVGEQIRRAREERLRRVMGDQAYDDMQERRQARMAEGQRPGDPRTGPSPLRRLGRNIFSYGSMLTEAYGNVLEQSMRDPMAPIGERGSRVASAWGFPARATAAGEEGRIAFRNAGGLGGGFTSIARGMSAFHEAMTKQTTATQEATSAVTAHGRALRATAGLVGGGIRDVARGGGSMLGGALRSGVAQMGGAVGLGIAGVTGLIEVHQMMVANQDEARKAWASRDMSEAINSYRESIGKATGTVQTMGEASAELNKTLAKTTTTFEDATRVRPEDVAAAATGEPIRRYTGSAQEIAAQIGINAPTTGMSPDEVQAVKVDLLRQKKSQAEVNEILKAIPTGALSSTGGARANPNLGTLPGIAQSINAVGSAGNQGGIVGWLNSVQTRPFGVPNYEAPKAPLYGTGVSDIGQQQIKDIASGLTKRQAEQVQQGLSPEYAKQEYYKGIQEVYEEAVKTNQPAILKEVEDELTRQLGGAGKEAYITPGEVEKSGGSIVQAYAATDQGSDFKKSWDEFLKDQKNQPGGAFGAEIQPGYYSKLLKDIAPDFSRAFDQSRRDQTANAFDASRLQPGNAGLMTTAGETFVRQAENSTKSLADLAVEAHNAANNVDETSVAFQQIKASAEAVALAMQKAAINQTPQQTQTEQFKANLGIATSPLGASAASEQERKAAEQAVYGDVESDKARMIQRLQVQRQFNIQRTRNDEDYTRSRFRANQDYETQVSRTTRNYNTQRSRMIYDYNTQVTRANEDYTTQIERQQRDFHTDMLRAEHDFQKTRAREIRDFNLQIARNIEDAARSIYDPYSRIQTKATWDAKNLMVNLKEQNDAIAKQKAQLDQLRAAGVSAQAIDQLQLGKSENAQQVNNLAQDLTQSPEIAQQLNALATQRAGLTGAMYLDSSNTELKRSKEDFNKTLDDQTTDYTESIDRAVADLHKNLDDEAFDFHRSMLRTSDDFHLTLQRNEDDLKTTLGDMAFDLHRSLDRMYQDFTRGTDRMIEDLHEADMTIGGDFKAILEQTMKAMNGQAVSWTGIITNSTQALLDHINNNVVPSVFDAAGKMGIQLPGMPPSPSTDMSHDYGPNSAGYGGVASSYGPAGSPSVAAGIRHAEGGPIEGHSPHSKADNILSWLTAGEFVHPVDTVNYYGGKVMEAIRNRAIPKYQLDELAGGQNPGVSGSGYPSVAAAMKQLASGGMDMTGILVEQMMPAFAAGGKVAGRTGSQALTAAMMQVNNILNTCLSVVQEWWQSGHAFPTAFAQWQGTAQHPGDRNPPIGAPIFTKGKNPAGHIAIYAGNGMARSTDAPTPTHVGTVPLSYFEGSWGHQYLGWGSTLAGANLRFDTGPDGITSPGSGAVTGAPRPQADYAKMFAGFDHSRTDTWYASLRDRFEAGIKNSIETRLDQKYGTGNAGVNTPGYDSKGGAAQWSALALQVLGMLGRGNGELGALLRRINTESAGNPRAINLTDSNAAAGHPSKGLMQTIDTTFAAYRNPNLSGDIYDPLANIYAGSNYAVKRYGSIAAIDPLVKHGGYDNGGVLQPGRTMTENNTGKPEKVLTDEQWSSISQLAEHGSRMLTNEQGRQLTAAGGVHLTIDKRTINNDHRTDMTGAQITVVAQDPEELGIKLRQKEWASRATATRGVNHGR